MSLEYYETSDLVGKVVYDGKGQRIGEVEKTIILKDGRGALIIKATNKIIPLEHVQSVADIILMRPAGAEEARPVEPLVSPIDMTHTPEAAIAQAGPTKPICPKCKCENKLTAKFCVKCGARLS